MQLNDVEPAVYDALKHLPYRLKQPDPTVVTPAFWYQNNYAPKHLAGDDAMGPDRLDQLNKKPPIIPISRKVPLALRVFLLQRGPKPRLNMLGTHARGSPCTAIR